jgi:hypothetical protein
LNPPLLEIHKILVFSSQPHFRSHIFWGVRASLLQENRTTKFLDTILLTLYGDAFAPREEYLLLKLFHLAILQEIKHSTDPNKMTQTDSPIPKLVMTYNKRKQGTFSYFSVHRKFFLCYLY